MRVSTDEQKLGPEAQRAQIEGYAARQGLRIASWHLDHGVSGAAPLEERAGLLEAVAALKREGAALLLISRRDRLARDRIVVAMVESAVQRTGARIVSADGVANEDTPESDFMRTILDGASAYERALIRTRTKAALQAKKRRGERVGGVPFGYQPAEDGVHLVPEPTEQAVLDRILQLHKEGLGARRITRICVQEGICGRTGRVLQLTQVVRILTRAKTNEMK